MISNNAFQIKPPDCDMANSRKVFEFERIRIDKWLWAARFFKTRGLAKQAIEGGKVQVDGQRTKPSKEIEIGAMITVKQGFDEKTIIVKSLSDQRRPYSEAKLMFEETDESIEKRLIVSEQRKAQPSIWTSPSKPNKKQRRLIHEFKQRS
tara:strand:- start:420 stop:869 length:450 start_codon:yes stop_codon:yes gene_type:complete